MTKIEFKIELLIDNNSFKKVYLDMNHKTNYRGKRILDINALFKLRTLSNDSTESLSDGVFICCTKWNGIVRGRWGYTTFMDIIVIG